ncbi:MAG: hypothetical protein Ct9H90mP2_07480 [Dehalococcoidia bacterium]|nr:MAG: hypothetical protein Ct9H90mP2_07480 [Dehalococcoidia bacterium]
MRGKTRRLQLEYGLDFIILDYMQLLVITRGQEKQTEPRGF